MRVLLCLLACVLLWQASQWRATTLHYLDQNGQQHTLSLTVRDKKKLTALMQKLFAENSFAYTILGSKPLSWETYQKPLPLTHLRGYFDSFSEHNRVLRSGWKVWEKYQHLFPLATMRIESPRGHPEQVSILMINEERFNEVVMQNKKDFQDVLGREITDGFQLIRESKNQALINDVLLSHQGLIGIVLGYGRENAWKFLEGCKNHSSIGCVWEDNASSQESLSGGRRLTDFYLSHYSCPSFAGDPHSVESIAIKTEYASTRQKVVDYYKDKDFLEATLSLLAGYTPISRDS